MFADMFDSMDNNKIPKETFYDGYVVNAFIDASYASIKSKKWEPIKLDLWRGKEGVEKVNSLQDYDENYYLVKEEKTHYGDKKLLLKSKKDGKIVQKIIK